MKKIFLLILIVTNINAKTFKDSETGLEWEDNIVVKENERYWEDAKYYCQELVLNEKKDWRLPSIIELLSIFTTDRTPNIKRGFKNILNDEYWSSTEYIYSFTNKVQAAFIVDFGGGNVYDRTFEYTRGVICVRGKEYFGF